MPVNIPNCPDEVVNLLRQELQAFLKIKHHSDIGGPELPDIEASANLPHKVYLLTLEDIITGKGLADARFTGWRHIITEGDQKYAADVFSDEKGENHQFAGTHEGDLVKSFLVTLKLIQKQEAVQNEAFELCLLKIPALYVMAVWLKSPDGNGDLIVPLAPAHRALTPANLYTGKEFMDLLTGPAKEMAGFKM